MEQVGRPNWDAGLQELVLQGVVTSYALIGHTGTCLASCGCLGDELWSGNPSTLAQQLQAVFQTRERRRRKRPAQPQLRSSRPAHTAAARPPARPDPPSACLLPPLTVHMPDHLDVCGHRAVVVQRSEGSLYAVSRGKQLGMTAHRLPSGILVTVFDRPHLPQAVVPLVEAACDKLRQP